MQWHSDISHSLIQAVRDRKSGRVEQLLSSYGLSFSRNSSEGSVLRDALGIVELLLDHKANVDARKKNGETKLSFDVKKTYLMYIKIRLEHRPDVNNKSNRICLKAADADKKYRIIVENLLKNDFVVELDDVNTCELLQVAVEKGYLKNVEAFLKDGADVNMLCDLKYKKGFTLLHSAAANSHEAVVKLLISYGADVNAEDETGESPISYAMQNVDCRVRDEHIYKLVGQMTSIALGVDEDVKYQNGESPIIDPIVNINLNIIKILLTNGANVKGHKLLNTAVKYKFKEIVEILLQHGADVNATDDNKRTALHFTSYLHPLELSGAKYCNDNINAEIAKVLLGRGADVNAQTNYNIVTTLHHACLSGYPQVVEALLEYNADINISANNGAMALHFSVLGGNEIIIKMLLNKGADVNAKLINGVTALFIATRQGHKELVETLLRCGAKVNSNVVPSLTSPIHIAAYKGHLEIVKILLKFGADIDSRAKYSKTPLHIASAKGNKEIVATLLQHGADINITSADNRTPPCCSTLLDIISIYKQHIIKMKTANLYVSSRNLQRIRTSDWPEYLQNKCEEEMQRMKSWKISNSNVSLHDILTKSINQLAAYARNENILRVLRSHDYKTEFPIYADIIYGRFRKGVERGELLERGSQFFHSIFNGLPSLPQNCIEEIVSYLDNEYLRISLESFMPTSVISFCT